MSIRTTVKKFGILLSIMGLLTGAMWGSLAIAGVNPHVAEAIKHAEGAVDHGKQGHPDALVEHAEEALMHAQAAQKEVKNPHLDEGVHELMDAVEHGKAGHADVGTKHAKSAIKHLKEVK
jgi:hypothetical protein